MGGGAREAQCPAPTLVPANGDEAPCLPPNHQSSPPPSSFAAPAPLGFPFGSTELDRAESPYRPLRAGSHWRKVCHRMTQSESAQERNSGCDWLARRLPLRPRSLPPPRVVRRRGRWGRAQVAGLAARGLRVEGKYQGGGLGAPAVVGDSG